MSAGVTEARGFTNREGAAASGEQVSFSFGANWRKYIERLSDDAIANAIASFVQFSGRMSLAGETFLDIGCGSGLSSLVAHRLGAARVVSVDIDPQSIQGTQIVRSRFAGEPENWEVHAGSVLDRAFVESLGQHSYVYSWGVLHHTGAMWDAVANVAECVAPRGTLHLALYNHNRHAHRWHAIKRFYNRRSRFGKKLLRMAYGGYFLLRTLLRGQWPPTVIRQHRQSRGMDVWRDIEDWLGGLPYEFCKPDLVVEHLAPRGFSLRKIRTGWGHGCNEYLLTRDLPPQASSLKP